MNTKWIKLFIILTAFLWMMDTPLLTFSSFNTNPIRTARADGFPNPTALPQTPAELSAQLIQTLAPYKLSYHQQTGMVRFLQANQGRSFIQPTALPIGTTPEQAARSFLASYGLLFGLNNASEELLILREQQADQGRSFVRFQQVNQGVPVMGGELIVQMDADLNVVSVNGEILPASWIEEEQERTKLDFLVAQETALRMVSDQYNISIAELYASQPALWLYNPALLGVPGAALTQRVWRIEVVSTSGLPIRELVLVDVQTGGIALHFNQIDTSKYRQVYDNQNMSNVLPSPWPAVRVEGNPPTGNQEVDNAYDYMGFAYDYYLSHHARDSMDGLGMTMMSTVRYCSATECPYENANWSGAQLVFGEGFANADDIVVHEYTHGVTEFESRLYYFYQSGAINEAFSDIWGEFVDVAYSNGNDDDSPEAKWLHGEDGPGGVNRSLKDPPAYWQPDNMLDEENYVCGVADNGGVHYNSGVGNKAAFLISAGGVFNGYNIPGIGNDKTARIFYEVQTHLLTSASDYADLADALVLACDNLTGTYGITSTDCWTVESATHAVKMSLPPPCGEDEVPTCDATLLMSNFDANMDGWYGENGYISLLDGKLYLGSIEYEWSSIRTANLYDNIEFAAYLKRAECADCYNGLVIRGSINRPIPSDHSWTSGYAFLYNHEGYVTVRKLVGSNFYLLLPPIFSDAIYIGDYWQTLKVRAEGSQLRFYINNKLVWAGVDPVYTKGRAGILMNCGDCYRASLAVEWAQINGGQKMPLFMDSFETGFTNWYHYATSGSDLWVHDVGYATNGTNMAHGINSATIADSWLALKNSFKIPTDNPTYLTFDHAHDFDAATYLNAYYDGGVVEYSTDGGSSWSDFGWLYFTHNGYNGTITTSENPLYNKQAYVDNSFGYKTSRVDLASFEGSNLKIRFREGVGNTHQGLAGTAWYIDNIQAYYCVAEPQLIYLPYVQNGSSTPSTSFVSYFNDDYTGWQAIHSPWYVTPDLFTTYGSYNHYASAYYTPASFANVDFYVWMKHTGCSSCESFVYIRGEPEPSTTGFDWYKGYAFSYTNDGYFAVGKYVNGAWTYLQSFTYTPAIIANDFNKLHIIANGWSLTFYINDIQVWSGIDSSLFSGHLGFGMGADNTVNKLEVDIARLNSGTIGP